ncbi:MAG: hypothetical protein ACFFFB_06875 [Candidatus Heimdallarchaeota archaeon]
MSENRLTELRIENQKLKKQVQELESKVLSLVGMMNLVSSGGSNKKYRLNDELIEFINSTGTQLNIVSPKVDMFYATELKRLAKRGVPVLIITNDRGGIPKGYQEIYDALKQTEGINIINNPNVRYLLLFNSEKAIYSGGSLDKDELEKSILIVTIIKETTKLRSIAQIFSMMLPTFMRN